MPPLTRSKTLNDRLEAQRYERTAQNCGSLKLPGLPMDVKLMIYDLLLPDRCYATIFDYWGGPRLPDGWELHDGSPDTHFLDVSKLTWVPNLMNTCRTLRADLAPLAYRKILLLDDWCYADMSKLLDRWPAICSFCLWLRLDSPSFNEQVWERASVHIRCLPGNLGRFGALQELMSLGNEYESTDGGVTWVFSTRSMLLLRTYAKGVPHLSKVFFARYTPWTRHPGARAKCGGITRFMLPDATSAGEFYGYPEYEINIEQEVSIRKDHIRALRYQDMRGISTKHVKPTKLQAPQQRGTPGTFQPRDILEAAGAVRKKAKEASEIASTATDFSEADLLRISLVGMFLMGPLKHIIHQSGIQHIRPGA